MNIPDGFFENPVSPEYADLLSTMGAPIYFTAPPCCIIQIYLSQTKYRIIGIFKVGANLNYRNLNRDLVKPLNAQYEEVQPDLHSLERYDFSKMPDLLWYP